MDNFLEDRFFIQVEEVYKKAKQIAVMDDIDAGRQDGMIEAVRIILLAAMSMSAVEKQLKEWDEHTG